MWKASAELRKSEFSDGVVSKHCTDRFNSISGELKTGKEFGAFILEAVVVVPWKESRPYFCGVLCEQLKIIDRSRSRNETHKRNVDLLSASAQITLREELRTQR
uniref:Transposase n=1 Tax=Ascaris lumbricoides TaxID=6252 RepID=A0A0M3I3T7_ASCLU